jgi:DNA polymerase-3 subunit epsilon
MGAWYLERLEQGGEPREPVGSVFCGAAPEAAEETEQSTGVALFQSPEREQLRALIERARGRLADLQAEYTTERRRVDAANAALYRLLQDHYLRRDRLRLIVDYRRRFLETLLNSGEDEAEEVSKGYRRARAETDREYQEAEREVARKVELSEAEMEELKRIYRMLAKLYHPDAHQNDPEKRAIYEKLMAAINKAKDEGAFDILSEIAADPEAFIAKQGWGKMDGARDESIEGLRRLYTALELEIIAQIEALSVLKESPEYEFMRLSGEKPEFLHNVAAQQRLGLIEEIEKLKIEAEDLANQIEELTGKASTI